MGQGYNFVIKLPPCTDKDRAKAMQIAAATGVVTTVSIMGQERDHLVVVGGDIDVVSLTQSLRKKFKGASVVRVQPVWLGPPRTSHRNYAQYNDDDDDDDSSDDNRIDRRPTDYRSHRLWPASSHNNRPSEQGGEADESGQCCTIM